MVQGVAQTTSDYTLKRNSSNTAYEFDILGQYICNNIPDNDSTQLFMFEDSSIYMNGEEILDPGELLIDYMIECHNDSSIIEFDDGYIWVSRVPYLGEYCEREIIQRYNKQ